VTRRLQEPLEEPARPVAGDYFVVGGDCGVWYVSTAMARAIDSSLAAVPQPGWVTFVDLTGARIRLRTRQIDYLCQCTADQRTAERAFFRSLKQERKADRSWDGEE
jgi:hypothetical protein